MFAEKMSHRRERIKDYRNSDIEDLKYKYYKELKEGKVKIRGSGKYLFCPYCSDNRREYISSELERHASRIARESKSASFGDKARHLGLHKYLLWYESAQRKSQQSTYECPEFVNIFSNRTKSELTPGIKSHERASSDRKLSWSTGKNIESVNEFLEVKAINRTIGAGEMVTEKRVMASDAEELGGEPGEIITESAEGCAINRDTAKISDGKVFEKDLPCQSLATTRKPTQKSDDELIVWPWMAIVANIPNEIKDGRYVGESGRKLREEWLNQGFNPIKVLPLWDFRGHSGFAVVEFNKDWEGFKNAMAFEKAFEINHHGRRDWFSARDKGDKLYGWLAREEDYRQRGLIGKHLQKNGDLKTLAEIQGEDDRRNTSLVSNLTNELLLKDRKCEEITKKISKTEIFMTNVMAQKEEMVQSYNEEMKKLLDDTFDHLRKTSEEHKRSKAQLEAQREKLIFKEKQLKQRQNFNENEKRKLDKRKKMNERAIMEQKKADDKMLKLAEEQKRKKELLLKRIIELEAKLDQKQALQLQIERMRGELEVRKHMIEEGDMEDKKKLESIESELRDKEEELDGLESLNQTLIIKERKTNDELQEARKELINGLKNSRASICVKRMGDLDGKPFVIAAKRKYYGEDVAGKAMELCSLWEDNLRDPSWHPYKVVMDGENHKELLDEDDEKLKELRAELGDEVYEAVTAALNELNQYNPSGRYPLPELWNSNEKRKASLKDGIEHLLKQWKLHKARRRKN